MASASRYLEQKILDHTLGVASFAAISPSNLRMALFTSSPGELNNTSTEVNAAGYSRQPIIFNTSTAASTSGSVSVNAALVQFGPATVDWGTVTHWGLYDSPSAGNLLFYEALVTPVTITTGSTYDFSAGTVQVGVD